MCSPLSRAFSLARCSSSSTRSRASSTLSALSLLRCWERSFWQETGRPLGVWVMRTAGGVFWAFWPPLLAGRGGGVAGGVPAGEGERKPQGVYLREELLDVGGDGGGERIVALGFGEAQQLQRVAGLCLPPPPHRHPPPPRR